MAEWLKAIVFKTVEGNRSKWQVELNISLKKKFDYVKRKNSGFKYEGGSIKCMRKR
jgi:hypothetical protein